MRNGVFTEGMENSAVDEFNSRRSTVYGPTGIVATSQPLASQTGIQVLQQGGNAFDAAVATAAALNVVEPTSTGLGGDVFMLYKDADGNVGSMRSCGGAPSDATREKVAGAIADDGESPEEVTMPDTGPHTVTVPGTARGWEATVQEFGRLSLSDVLQPAIGYAIDGYPVSEVIADQWTGGETLFQTENARDSYLVNGERAPEPGELVQLEKLGESMRAIAREGADVVYEGYIAEEIVNEVQRHGGFLTVDDLSAFDVEYPSPVSTEYGGATVYELPPNNQGLIALEALNIAEEIGVRDYPQDSGERMHYLVESLKLAFHDGHRYITDPAFEDIPPLGSKQWAASRAGEIGETAGEVSIGLPNANAELADTVLLCVADAEGNVVSYINSRFSGFGSGLVAGDTGIALQNRGASFSLDPSHSNRLEPEKKPFHTLIPGIAEFDEDDWGAFGVMGGFMQPQGHLQMLVNLIDDGQSLQQELDYPRWRYMEDGTLSVETRIPSRVQHELIRRGHSLQVARPSHFGGAQIVRKTDGVMAGATEPRKDGIVSSY
jgi:gamma-glutamyltranspeptidase/glutathione hydrolase